MLGHHELAGLVLGLANRSRGIVVRGASKFGFWFLAALL
jgi:hypothetical protein